MHDLLHVWQTLCLLSMVAIVAANVIYERRIR